jgi:hypothetical protein
MSFSFRFVMWIILFIPFIITTFCPNGSTWSLIQNRFITGADYYICEIDELQNGATVVLVALHTDFNTATNYARNLCYGNNSVFNAYAVNSERTAITMKNTLQSDYGYYSASNWQAWYQQCQ